MKPSTAKGISVFLKVLANLTAIGGLILGLVLGKDLYGDFDFNLAIVYWVLGIIYGMIILAISAIIDLLLQIRGKIFGESDHAENEEDAITEIVEEHNPIRIGQCELCGKENEDLYPVRIGGKYATIFKDVCAECASKPSCMLIDE